MQRREPAYNDRSQGDTYDWLYINVAFDPDCWANTERVPPLPIYHFGVKHTSKDLIWLAASRYLVRKSIPGVPHTRENVVSDFNEWVALSEWVHEECRPAFARLKVPQKDMALLSVKQLADSTVGGEWLNGRTKR